MSFDDFFRGEISKKMEEPARLDTLCGGYLLVIPPLPPFCKNSRIIDLAGNSSQDRQSKGLKGHTLDNK